MLFDSQEKRHCILEVVDHDPKMYEAFAIAGRPTGYSAAALSKIAAHKLVVYITAETGNLADAKYLADTAAMLLHAGGLGVKVETTGKAFEKEQWLEQLTDFEEYKLYPLFVLDSIVDREQNVYSCGMHNLGQPDTIVSGVPFQEAVNLMQTFHYYQLMEQPVITNNQTFSTAPDAPVYIITEETEQPYQGDELFENPFGMWRLTPAS